MAAIDIVQVCKSYGAEEVIHDLNLEIPDREFVVLVGPSGCGKSTLLRMMAGLEEVTEGYVHFDGKDVTDVPPKNRDVAMVFQNYALYPHMTVFQNMAFGLKARRMAKSEIEQRVAWAAELLGLSDFLARHPRQLSGGQRQRVAMGRAIVRTPRVFLFDEPLSNLDALLRVEMRTEVKALHRRLDTTFVYVTHDQVEAMTMADRMVVMRDGRIEQVGTPLEVYETPGNTFVAGFIGSPSMNMVTGTVRSNGASSVVEAGDGIAFAGPAGAGASSERVVVGFRPRDLKIVDRSVPNALSAKVEFIEHTGVETFIFVRIGETRLCASVEKGEWQGLGEEVWVRPDPTSTHYFDERTRDRIP